ncbi:MAG: acyltransferase family protein [Anaerolineae bacterium]|jgi:1-acyl-sn-glycerol-3-phosphate acyltransferase|nr:acyltransferase family protein [Anaerolineae bacterium]
MNGSITDEPLPGANGQPEPSPEEMQAQLREELDALIARVESASDYQAPPYSPQALVKLLEENAARFQPEFLRSLLGKLRENVNSDLLDLDTWKGIWYIVNYQLQSQADSVKRRSQGEYETDDWGLDQEFIGTVQPFLTFMYRSYWRVQTSGLDNIPGEGPALLTCNHSGQLPWDGAMVGTSVYLDHPAQRLVRSLYATWFPTVPFISATLTKMGQALATVDNGTRLLQEGNLVAVFPEGYKGVGKLFKDRYRLARFGRGGFVKMALRTGAPIIPVSIVGAEETYISLYKSQTIAKVIGFPYFPISVTFPWLGPLGFVPLPTKWFIDFGTPIETASYGPAAANNLVLVSQLTDQVRNVVQDMIHQRLAERRSVFRG